MSKNSPDHPVNEVLSPQKLLVYGIQHVLAMYVGAVTIPLVVGAMIGLESDQIVFLISADLFTCGIATLIQTLGFWKFGIRIPVVQGVTFTCVQPIAAVALATIATGASPEQSLVVVFASVMIAGLFTMLTASLFSKIVHLFPPVVTGSIILTIGLSLLPVGLNMVGGQNYSPNGEEFGAPGFLIVGFSVVVVILLANRFLRGFLKSISVLIGLAAGLIIAIPFGYINFSSMASAAWFRIDLPLGINMPWHASGDYFSTFASEPFHANIIPAVISMVIVMVITMVESTGSYFAVGEIIDLDLGKKDVARGLRAEGLSTMLGGCLNAMPYTNFVQNIGLVTLTGVRSRFVVASAGVILILLGLVPKLAAFFDDLPSPVIGGAAFVMFATVAANGINTLSKADLNVKPNNIFIIAVSVGIGVIPTVASEMFSAFPPSVGPLLSSGVTLTSITAIVLNILFNGISKNTRPEDIVSL